MFVLKSSLSLLLHAWTVASYESNADEPVPKSLAGRQCARGGQCTDDDDEAVSMLAGTVRQRSLLAAGKASSSAGSSSSEPSLRDAEATHSLGLGYEPRNLVVLLDMDGQHHGKRCWWPRDASCDSSIAHLRRLLQGVRADQRVYYHGGVPHPAVLQRSPANFSLAVRDQATAAYDWLSEEFREGDRIFVLAAGTAGLSARYLQGMLHDLAPRGERAGTSASGIDAVVHFMGLFDASLGSLYTALPGEQQMLNHSYLRLTATVKRLMHALALSETRPHLLSGELLPHPATHAEQVWFMGSHGDVTGGLPSKGPANIALGWLLDSAEVAGLLLHHEWRELVELSVDFTDAIPIPERNPADAQLQSIGLWNLRNPVLCRNETSGAKQPIKLHVSIKERMKSNDGWIPLPWCCDSTASAIESAGVRWVSNRHYFARKHNALESSSANWVHLSFGKLQNVIVPEIFWAPTYYVTVQNWHSSVPLPDGQGAAGGCCHAVRGDAVLKSSLEIRRLGSALQPVYKASVNFAGLELLLPLERATANQIVVEVHEDDAWLDDFVGRFLVSFDDLTNQSAMGIQQHAGSGLWLPRDIDGSHGTATLDVAVTLLTTDASAMTNLALIESKQMDEYRERDLPAERLAQCEITASRYPGLSFCGPRQDDERALDSALLSVGIHAVELEGCDAYLHDLANGAL